MSLREDPAEIKDLKLKEINCVMGINWQNDIQTCEVVEKALVELTQDILPECEASQEEKQFI